MVNAVKICLDYPALIIEQMQQQVTRMLTEHHLEPKSAETHGWKVTNWTLGMG